MSKKKKIPVTQTVPDIKNPSSKVVEPIEAVDPKMGIEKIVHGYFPYLLILVMSLVLYGNTFKHQFALDDDIVICKNEYVIQGLAGLPDIFSKDLFDSFYKQMNTTAQLSGGRYRPLSVASFALEQEFIGTRPDANFPQNIWDTNQNGKQDEEEDINKDGLYNDKDIRTKGFGLRHVNNVLFYALAISILFLFLSRIVFKEKPVLALIISLLFLAHPIHTEVVANVKSRDEIFSLLFMALTLYLAHQYDIKRSLKWLVYTCISLLCALLSKEYGITLFLLVPLSLYLFGDGLQIQKNIKLYGGMMISGIIYFLMRSSSGLIMGKSNLQDQELLNNPYLLASETERMATQFYVYFKYLLLQIFPHPLASDYGYNSIPYKDFSHPGVWLGLVVLLVSFAGMFIWMKQKKWLAFALAFYTFNALLVTNFIFNIGATMGERLVFHSSLGFCMLLGFGLYWLGQKLKNPIIAFVLLLPILIAYSIKTHARNKAWENDITLAITDVDIQPNSVSLNGNASSRYIDLSEMPANKNVEKEYLNKSIRYGKKAVGMHDKFVNGYINLGLAYAKLEQFDSSKVVWDKAFKIYPSHPQKKLFYNLLSETYYSKGYNLGGQQKWGEGKLLLQKAVEVSPDNAKYWYDLGGFAFNDKDYNLAKQAWNKAYQLNPTDTNILKVQGLLK